MRFSVRVVGIGLAALVLSVGVACAQPQLRFLAGDPDPKDHGLAKFRHVVRSITEWQGRTWVGTYGSGLYAIDASGVKQYVQANSPLLENRVNVLGTRKGELWIGTCAGFNIFDGTNWKKQTKADGLADNIYHAVLVDEKDRVWVGTAGKGISVYEDGKWRSFGVADGLTELWINALAFDERGVLWTATLNRIYRLEGQKWVEEVPRWAKLPASPTAVACRENELWCGSAFAALVMHQGGTWYAPPLNLPSAQVNALAVDKANRLWVGTDSGIVRYHPQDGWRKYRKDEGLADENVRVLTYCPVTGRLWAGSFLDGWVYVYDPSSDRFEGVLRAGVPVGGGSWAARKRRE